jgi:3-isopropylmalate/(R)-2-methylmalate dehydratase large subunit
VQRDGGSLVSGSRFFGTQVAFIAKVATPCTHHKPSVCAIVAPPQPQQRSPVSSGSVKHAMTATEKILARASEKGQLVPGENVWVKADILMTHDVCGPGTIGIFKKEFGQNAKVHPINI